MVVRLLLPGANPSAVKYNISSTLQTKGIYSWPMPMDVFYFYNTLGLIFLGTLGQLMNIITFRFQPQYTHKENYYLQMLSITNLLYLFTLMPNELKITKVIGLNGGCFIDTYLCILLNFSSAFIIIFFAIEHLLMRLYPQHVAKMKFLKENHLITILILALTTMMTGSIAYEEIYVTNACYTSKTHSDAPIFNSKRAAYYLLITVVAVFAISLWTAVGRCRLELQPRPSMEHRHAYYRHECREIWCTLNRSALEQSCDQWASYTEAHKLMWLVTKTFIVTTLPACIGSFFFDVDKSDVPGRWVALQRLLMMLFNTNFGINFFLYCLSGKNFRKALCKFFKCEGTTPTQPRLVRRDTPRFINVVGDSVDSRSTYRHSNVPTTSNADDDFYFPPPSGPPSTPRHEIMELVELPMRRPY